jgi:glucan phosphoethanolaminetransferase (alkaline phosphatase superfamily)
MPYGATALSLEVADGIFITVCMVYYVFKQRSGSKRSSRVANLVILYIVNSGALNLVFASTCLITYVKLPTTLIYAPSFFILVRLYVCSFITILNSRVHVRSRLRGDGRTVVNITHEQVIDGPQHSSLKLESHSSSEMLAMMRVNEGPTKEKAGVGDNIC